ncbi:nicotinate-nucleotide adenylyltransferase [Palleronia sediminis]|uniref:Probable nicotinate-nucleotide adenylyltransferase n=1 Tax=Palleronia sediminis TaxID=2547833 RepID=A0A4R6AEU5_9RHOB|nr:nicotinate-nucleotide adenylyltransferase [Palleronia sediminis]TDL79783.1 nicotinate-nucleotide adenylyltransferase [Palleronia sediminis]
MRGAGWPLARPGQAIGLLGGSFDPAHAGHVAVTRAALARLGLDRVWWLVSPGNPLKRDPPADLERRLTCARAVMMHPRVEITALETRLGTRRTAETVPALIRRYPGVRFVWLMGADNLVEFHKWDDWRRIVSLVPIAVLARPGQGLAAQRAVAARVMARARLPQHAARLLARSDPPAWVFLDMPLRDESSTRLRASGLWGKR